MDRSAPLAFVTSPDGLFDLTIIGIIVLAGLLVLWAGLIAFGYLPLG